MRLRNFTSDSVRWIVCIAGMLVIGGCSREIATTASSYQCPVLNNHLKELHSSGVNMSFNVDKGTTLGDRPYIRVEYQDVSELIKKDELQWVSEKIAREYLSSCYDSTQAQNQFIRIMFHAMVNGVESTVVFDQDIEPILNPPPVAKLQNPDVTARIDSLTALIKKHPKVDSLYVHRAGLLNLIAENKLAFDDLDTAIAINPNNNKAWFYKGYINAEMNKHTVAIQNFTEALKLNPQDYKSLFNRAQSFAALENQSAAIKDINACIDLQPKNAEFRRVRGILYLEVGQDDNGCKELGASYGMGDSLSGEAIQSFCKRDTVSGR
jgi:tetratricopeptide (TPR) repeat protein